MISIKDYTWKKNKLFLGKEYIGEVFNAEEDIWWIRWPDGAVSADFYNKDRAKENLLKYATHTKNSTEAAI